MFGELSFVFAVVLLGTAILINYHMGYCQNIDCSSYAALALGTDPKP